MMTPNPRGPVWEDLGFLRQFWLGGSPPDETSHEARRTILAELRRSDLGIEREFIHVCRFVAAP
jgi:hypothetical protein